MIQLYELYWSHYCEKVRWALKYKGLEWQSVKINAFTKTEMQQFRPNKNRVRTVPMIYDPSTDRNIYESSEILQYLEQTYADTPPLFPGNTEEQNHIKESILDLDTQLGLPMRRLAYTQCMLECPTVLAELFLSNQLNGILTWPVIRQISSTMIGIVLLQRFDMHLNESIGLFEHVEAYLLPLANHFKHNHFLHQNRFTAADLTLATHLRGLRIITFFRENPALAELFLWQENLHKQHDVENYFLYEKWITNARNKRAPMRRGLKNRLTLSPMPLLTRQPHTSAVNDQKRIGGFFRLLQSTYHYFFTLKVNKYRQYEASENIR